MTALHCSQDIGHYVNFFFFPMRKNAPGPKWHSSVDCGANIEGGGRAGWVAFAQHFWLTLSFPLTCSGSGSGKGQGLGLTKMVLHFISKGSWD